jgi:hypothetical protein
LPINNINQHGSCKSKLCSRGPRESLTYHQLRLL